MTSLRSNLALCGIAVLAFAPTSAQAQLDDGAVVNVLRECRKITDTGARTACYDNIPLGQSAAAAAAPAPAPTPAQANQSPPEPRGFGSDQLPPPPRAPAEAAAIAEPDTFHGTVTEASQRQPGVYLLTLEDGAQWQFVDSVPPSYDPPHAGSPIELNAAALGSYLLRYRGQRPVRIKRVR